MESFFHQTLATGIDLRQTGDVLKGIGKITAASAGEGYFLKGMGCSFIDNHLPLGTQTLKLDGTEASGGSCSYDKIGRASCRERV